MTPQEFFKKDLFAGKTGVELIEIKEGYSKARLVITEEHLNAGHRTQGGAHLYVSRPRFGRSRQLSRRTVLFTVFQYHFPARQRCRRHTCTPKPVNDTSDALPDIIKLTLPTRKEN